MTIIKALSAGFIAVSVCIAQIPVTISGKVMDSAGVTPIAGATVQLEKGGLQATSGADGSFLLSGATGTINSQTNKTLSGKIKASLHNSYLSLNLREKLDVEIALYTIQGKKLSTLHQTFAEGHHSVVLPTKAAGGMCFYRIKAEDEEFVLKGNFFNGVSRGTALTNQGTSSPAALTRQAERYVPINDVIKVEKDGYLNYRMIVTKSDTIGIEIKMVLQDAGTVTDIDGNVYHAIKIGKQIWTVENLRTTKYNDGTLIPNITEDSVWFSSQTTKIGAYCYYKNTTNADSIRMFGALYNWYTVNPSNPKKVAPAGWHVPSDSEWTILEKYLVLNGYNWDGTTDTSSSTYNKIAKSLAAKMDWVTYTIPGTIGNDLTKNNRSGFSALPGGFRYYDGTFYYQSYRGDWWSATEDDAFYAYHRYLYYGYGGLSTNSIGGEGCGFSVRLLRDN
jgi:uncharacterized protein (TIGR02145 family)